MILRPCDWTHTDLANYLVTPTDGKAITTWPNRDEAFLDVTKSIRSAIEEIDAVKAPSEVHGFLEQVPELVAPIPPTPRSSNMRLRKEFTEADRDRFLVEAFEYMERFFQNSLAELQIRNDHIEVRHRKVDANTFTSTIYNDGSKVAACSIRLGGILGNGIAYSDGDDAPSNSYNESMSVENDDQKLFLRPMGMPHMGHRDQSLSDEGAAEYYWSLLIHHLQGN